MIRWKSALCHGALVCSLASVPGAAAQAEPAPAALASLADVPTIDAVADVVVARDAGRVFVSQGTGPLLVASLTGVVEQAVAGTTSGHDLAVADGRVFMARPGAHEIVAVDVATLAVTAYDTGERCPRALAPAGDRVWFTGACVDEISTIGVLDTGTGVVGDTGQAASLVATSESQPGPVFATQGAVLARYLVEDGEEPALVLDTSRTAADGDRIAGLTVSPAGDRIGVVSDPGYSSGRAAYAYDATSLARQALARGGDSVTEFVFGDGGEVALSGGSSSTSFLALYRPGEREAWRGYQPSDVGGHLWGEDGGVAYAGGIVYLVTRPASGGAFRIRAIAPRQRSALFVDLMVNDHLSGPPRTGSSFRVRLKLDAASAERTVSVYSTTPDGTRRRIGVVEVPQGETVRLGSTLQANTVVEALYAGDAETEPAKETAKIFAQYALSVRVVNADKVRSGNAYVRSGKTAIVEARVLGLHPGCVRFGLKGGPGERRYTPLGRTDCLKVDRRGRARVRIASERNGRYYRLTITAKVDENEYARGTKVYFEGLQFCAGRIPCSEGG